MFGNMWFIDLIVFNLFIETMYTSKQLNIFNDLTNVLIQPCTDCYYAKIDGPNGLSFRFF